MVGSNSVATLQCKADLKGRFCDIVDYMIKGIILDIDGVIIGDKVGFNSPDPHPQVIKKLQEVKDKGIFVSLVTAKPHFAIRKIIDDAKLDNLHITDGGAVVVDPLNNKIYQVRSINKSLVEKVLTICLENDVYVELYAMDSYFIQKNQVSETTEKHTHILQALPIKVDSLVEKLQDLEVIKIIPIAKDENDKNRVSELLQPIQDTLELAWTIHPVALPLQFGIITAMGVSKKQGAQKVSESTRVDFKEMLGIGDSKHDWQFIELCQYGAAVKNASQELKDLVLSKGENYSFIGGPVDENGIIEILEHFV